MVVDFEGNEITFTRQDLLELTHAYCTSIHKSQGSEFPIVICLSSSSIFRMLQRPILYTGLTRAKQSLVLLGDSTAFEWIKYARTITTYTIARANLVIF